MDGEAGRKLIGLSRGKHLGGEFDAVKLHCYTYVESITALFCTNICTNEIEISLKTLIN